MTAEIEKLLAEAEAALEGVTEGPWRVDGEPWNQIVWSGAENRVCFMAHSNGLDDDRDIATARFIAWARNNVPALIAALRAMQAEKREMALDVLAASGQAQEAYEAQLAAEAKLAEVEKDLRASKISEVFWRDGWRALDEDKRDVEATVATLTAQVEAMREAAEAIADDVCSYICPSTGRAGTPIQHDPRCVTLRAAISDAKGGHDA